MKNRLLITAIGLFSLGSAFAQNQFTCGLNKKLAALYAENPQLEKDHEKLLLNAMHSEVKSGEKTIIFTIPVVFHIIHTYGSENITDDQVRDQMEILNRDYRLMNDDTSDVVNEFKQVYGDVGIEFKLATIDPFGNCTNGIEHVYSHETFQGDDYSKVHQWYRANYLNIWVVSQMENGVAGYAYYPTAVEGSGFFRDGIIILNDYIGRIGTGSEYNSRALTHEIGHYLGLSHTWGSTNDPGVACGDDYMPDTPITKGSELACNLSMAVCDTNIIENVQNYMDYSYCSRMFSLDQVSAMRNIIQTSAAHRDSLITSFNHSVTGVDLTNPPVCIPTADFNAAKKFICKGASVQFKDFSYNADVLSKQWIFQDGTPATSTADQPLVTYDVAGDKTVTLIVTNSIGSDTLIMTNYIHVSENYADFVGPKLLDLNVNYTGWFKIDNPEGNYAKYSLINTHGYNNSKCFKLNNYKDISEAWAYSTDYFYYDRLGGNKDGLITPSFNLSNTSNITFSFKYAFSTNSTNVDELTDNVKVYVSKNCGETWILKKTITGTELLSMGYAGYTDYEPTNNNVWKTASFAYTSTSTDLETRFKIEFNATDKSGNFFVDDIMVDGILGISQNMVDKLEIMVYPNPLNSNQELNISYQALSDDVEFVLRDVQGKVIKSVVRTEKNQEVQFNMAESLSLPAACYFLEIKTGEFSSTKKIIVL